MNVSNTTLKAKIVQKNTFKDEKDVFEFIFSFTNTEQNLNKKLKRAYRLDRMKILLKELGHPENSFATIHIAGTKGKGSTAAFIANALTNCGIKTGLYTSPHVLSPTERISIPGQTMNIKAIITSAETIRETVNNKSLELAGYQSPTTFELLTALAFLYFRNTGCKLAVIETGIGGRLDATNVIIPIVSVITPINREHTDVLGNTLGKIALEKAGIIKRGIPVFSSKQRVEVKEILTRESHKKETSIRFIDEEIHHYSSDVSISGTKIYAKFKNGREINFSIGMIGDFQAENALLAYHVAENVLLNTDLKGKLKQGDLAPKITMGLQNTRLPGRFEVFPIKKNEQKESYIVLDGAHTPVAIRRILKNFNLLFRGRKILIFGAVKGKNYREMARHLAPHFEKIIVSKPDPFKESEPDKIFNFFKNLNPHTHMEANPAEALKEAMKKLTQTSPAEGSSETNIYDAILVTGSFYMISEIERTIKNITSIQLEEKSAT